jgi:hypothetical protein
MLFIATPVLVVATLLGSAVADPLGGGLAVRAEAYPAPVVAAAQVGRGCFQQ